MSSPSMTECAISKGYTLNLPQSTMHINPKIVVTFWPQKRSIVDHNNRGKVHAQLTTTWSFLTTTNLECTTCAWASLKIIKGYVVRFVAPGHRYHGYGLNTDCVNKNHTILCSILRKSTKGKVQVFVGHLSQRHYIIML